MKKYFGYFDGLPWPITILADTLREARKKFRQGHWNKRLPKGAKVWKVK